MKLENSITGNEDLQEKLVTVNRVAKVVKGGRQFGFAALTVVGDGNGKVGIGRGKSREVPLAIQKAMEDARRSMVFVSVKEGTLQYAITSTYGAAKVYMQPASEGTGIIAGGPMRAVFEVVGINNVLAKSIGSTNPINVIRATIKGLELMSSPKYVAEKRGKSIEEFIDKNREQIAIDNDGIGKGSARSIAGFDLYEALTEVSGHLQNYGGHPMAAGLTISEENLEDFKKAFLTFAETNLSEEDMEPRLKIDAEIQLNDINRRFMRFLELLGPYGPGNMRPKFVARNLKVAGNPRIVGNGNHCLLYTSDAADE